MAFTINIYYTGRDTLYYLPLDHLRVFWERAQAGGRKSFRYEELSEEFVLPKKQGILIPYLDMIQKDLDRRA